MGDCCILIPDSVCTVLLSNVMKPLENSTVYTDRRRIRKQYNYKSRFDIVTQIKHDPRLHFENWCVSDLK